MPSGFVTELGRRILVFDGAMGTQVHARDLSVERDYAGCENCTDVLTRTRPDVIGEIHAAYLAAGADAVETNTFGANALVLAEFGLASEAFALNKQAAEIARAACERFASRERPRFVAGSIGPGTRLVTLGNTDWEAMFASYREQARGLLAGGIDVFLIETCQDLLQVKCAINACLAALDGARRTTDDVPIMVSLTIESTGTMLLGTAIEAAAAALARYPVLSLGLNCATGPTEMAEHVRWLGRNWAGAHPAGAGTGPVDRCVSVMPNAGLPVLVEGRADYPLRPGAFVEAMLRFVERDGVRIVGGCCGTTPEHIRLLAAGVAELERAGAGRAPGRGRVAPGADGAGAPEPSGPVALRARCTSLFSAVEYRQDASYLIVGERLNASGSRRFKHLLEAEDWDGIVSMARQQVREDGAHVLDVNVDDAGRDNARDMREIVRRLVRQVDAPLMLDSTQPGTIEAGLRCAGGKCLINSANFEDGPEKFERMVALARTYGAGLVCGTIDEDPEAAMARTAGRKAAIARRLHRAATALGLPEEDILFDPLVLPVSTGMASDRRSALETIEGVRRIAREFPACQIVVGLSNVSFGLAPAARVVLNSAFLAELRDAGLTAAIVHASKILPRDRIPPAQWEAALDVIHDRRGDGADDPLQRFIALFAQAGAEGGPGHGASPTRTLEERLRAHIIDGEKRGLEGTLEEARRRYTPLEIINDHLLDGMRTVGELFGSGRMQLPFVLQSAEVMKAAVTLLEPHMERATGPGKGSIVLATVKGDVHDIGKNLVDIILSNNGYTVHNLGIKQPLAEILNAWRRTGADAIGLSGLLVKSVQVMEENLREMREQGVDVPVLLGGAALSRHHCEGRLRAVYRGRDGRSRAYYGKDAFEGLRVMDRLVAGRAAELDAEIDERLAKRALAESVIAADRAGRADGAAAGTPAPDPAAAPPAPPAPPRACRAEPAASGADASAGSPRVEVPAPPFWGSRVVESIDPDEVYPYINKVALYRGQWQFKRGAASDEAYGALVADEAEPVFRRLCARCRDEGVIQPRVVYGYFPCQSDGDDLIVYEPGGGGSAGGPGAVLERFTFPRQRGRRRLCISDFFRPVSSGEMDVLALQCVTVGPRVGEEARALFARHEYREYLFLHGFGVECAEALAELWHKRIRQELGIAGEDSASIRALFTQGYRGSRYSFGYPACPDLADQARLWRLLRPERIGCALTENWQIDPEQSTSAIIAHHPAARYFNV